MSFWDRCAGIYDLVQFANRKANAETVRRVEALVPQWASVLECAAGTGEFSLAAARRAGSVLCTDLSRTMLDRAEEKAKKQGLTNIAFAVRDLTDLPEGDGTYDIVIAAHVLHLLPRTREGVAELWRVTAPGGKLILPTYLLGEMGLTFRALIRLYKCLGFQPRRNFTLENYRAFFRNQGLAAQVVRIPGPLPVGLAVLKKPL